MGEGALVTTLSERRGSTAARPSQLLLGASCALAGLGIVMVYSASGALAERYGSQGALLLKQSVWACVAACALVVGRIIDYRLYVRHGKAILGGTLLLLLLVLVPGIGTRLGGARRWIRFAGVGFQPSDVAKPALVFFLASFFGRSEAVLSDFKRGFLPPVLAVGAMAALVALEPDIGTSALICALAVGMALAGGARIRHIVPVLLLSIPPAAGFVLTRLTYVRVRILTFFNPSADPLGAGYHARQSLIALASGGLFGKGLGNGEQKLFFLPEAHSDFILAVIGEELGLLGTWFVLACFAALVLAGAAVARAAPEKHGALIATGITLWLGLQAALNFAVVTVSMPTKGIPLPFVSYGGSALVTSFFSIGVLLNIAAASKRPSLEEEVSAWPCSE